jgi:hypothetical protein
VILPHVPLARTLLFAFFVLTPSCEQVEKYFGGIGVAAYLILGTAALFVAERYFYARLRERLTEPRAILLGICTLVLLLVVFLVVYPRANSSQAGKGSDLDDELNVAAELLLSGRDPYIGRTYLGNPINLLPGELLLAVPFVVVLGNSAYQNIFWLAAFFWIASRLLRGSREALLLIWLLLAVSPVVLQQTLTGGDHVSNAVHVLVGALLLIRADRTDRTGWSVLAGGVLLGVGLSSRANFALLLPLIAGMLARRAGRRRATALTALVVLVALAVTIPFYMWGSTDFVPLTQLGKATQYAGGSKLPALMTLGLIGLTAVWLATRSDAGEIGCFLGRSAIVQAMLVWWLVALDSLEMGEMTLENTGYGTFYLCFGVMALWPTLAEPSDTVRIDSHG